MHITYQNIQFCGHKGGRCSCTYSDILYQNVGNCKLQNNYFRNTQTGILFYKETISPFKNLLNTLYKI